MGLFKLIWLSLMIWAKSVFELSVVLTIRVDCDPAFISYYNSGQIVDFHSLNSYRFNQIAHALNRSLTFIALSVFLSLLKWKCFLSFVILMFLFVLRELGLIQVIEVSWCSLVLMESVDMLV